METKGSAPRVAAVLSVLSISIDTCAIHSKYYYYKIKSMNIRHPLGGHLRNGSTVVLSDVPIWWLGEVFSAEAVW